MIVLHLIYQTGGSGDKAILAQGVSKMAYPVPADLGRLLGLDTADRPTRQSEGFLHSRKQELPYGREIEILHLSREIRHEWECDLSSSWSKPR